MISYFAAAEDSHTSKRERATLFMLPMSMLKVVRMCFETNDEQICESINNNLNFGGESPERLSISHQS